MADAMTTPTPLREALLERMSDRDPDDGWRWWTPEAIADFLLAGEAMQAVADPERTDSAFDLQTERDLAEAYYPTLERHLREHGCDHDFAEVANADGVLGGDSKDLNAERAEHEAVGQAVARLPDARGSVLVIANYSDEEWEVTAEWWEGTVLRHGAGRHHDMASAIVAALGPADAGVDAPVTSWADHDFKPMRTGTIGSPCQWCGKPGLQHRAALGPSEGERTEAGT